VIHCAEVAGGEEATLETVSANRCRGVQRVYNLLQFSKSDLIIFYLKTRAYLESHGESEPDFEKDYKRVVLYPVCKDFFSS
jgi:hypothetical protein